MKNVLIIHGTDFEKTKDQSQNNWFPWLKDESEKRGYKVYLPELPKAWQPNTDRYWKFIKDKFEFNSESILIGHSSGSPAILGFLEKLPRNTRVKAVISVAGFLHDRSWNCEGLFTEPFNWKKIRSKAGRFFVIHSDNDPYVPSSDAKEIATNLKTNVTLRKGQGHFSLGHSPKFTKFPYLLEIFDQIESDE